MCFARKHKKKKKLKKYYIIYRRSVKQGIISVARFVFLMYDFYEDHDYNIWMCGRAP